MKPDVSTWIAQRGYRFAGMALYPFLRPALLYRVRKGKEDRARLNERLGHAAVARPDGPLVWIHAASVGETLAVAPLIEMVRGYGISILLTTGTVTSARLAAERFGDRVIHQYVPVDTTPSVRNFLDHWRPDLAVNVETEVWPVTIAELNRRRVAHIIVNGRISDRSFDRWMMRRGLARSLFSRFACILTQTDLDAERFSDLGALNVSVSGNIKVDREAPPADPREVGLLQESIGSRPVWAAISTFEGEEQAAAEVHLSLKARFNRPLTIIVPRHPNRAEAIALQLQEQGLKVARRSCGDPLEPDTDILLGDTMGDMGLYLRLTRIAFVGRSLTARGGQNPLEPAMLGAAVLTGRNVDNFREAYRQLRQRGAVRTVDSVEALRQSVELLMRDAKARETMVSAGFEAVREMRGALARTMKGLERYLAPLILEARFCAKSKSVKQPSHHSSDVLKRVPEAQASKIAR